MKFPSREQWLFLGNILVSRWVNSGKNIASYTPKKILCIKWDEIGDMATCTHVFSLLKQKFPLAEIHVITKPYSAPLIENHPAVDAVFTRIEDWKMRYDLVVELRGNRKSLWRTFRFYPKVRLDRGIVRLRHKGSQVHETITNYEIIAPVLGGLPNRKPELFPAEKNKLKADLFISQNKLQKFAVIHVGARKKLRRWNDAGYISICNYLYSEKGFQLVFIGVAEEEDQIARIAEGLTVPYVLCTRDFSLMDLAALLQKTKVFLGNESGPLQLADVMGTPSLGLFGPGVKNVFYPQGPRSAVIHHVLECNPCDQIHCVHLENTCMNRIEIAEVRLALEGILSAHSPENNF